MSGGEGTRSGRVAFGLYAGTVALKAKTGARVSMFEAAELARMWAAHLPEDADTAVAVTRFIAGLGHDAPAAGEALLAFLDPTPEGAQLRACEAVLADLPELAELPDWTRRADCGLG